MVDAILGRLDILSLFLAIMVACGIYSAVDGLSRLGVLSGENGRKAIHVTIGVFAASFPVFMSRTNILVFHGMFFVGLVVLSLASDFVRMHKGATKIRAAKMVADTLARYEDVNRWTIGQFLYPLSLVFVVLLYDDMLIYSFAVLMMALADGFAAVIGKTYGKIIFYVPGGQKSLVGSLAFFSISFTLFSIYLVIETDVGLIGILPALIYALTLTAVEAGIAGGFDNIAIPLLTAVLLNTLQ